MVHVWARDILPTSLPNNLQDTGQNPFLDERCYPNSLWKSAEGREKTRDISQKSSHVFPEKSHVSHDNSESNNLIDELLDDTLDTLAAPAGNDDWKEAAWTTQTAQTE